jgi:hypothetical protein
MIDELSESLRSVLTKSTNLPKELAGAQVVFDRPVESFNPQQTTINLFLYDIREDVDLRSNEPVVVRQHGEVFSHRSPIRVACSYLITAWQVGGEDLALREQRLLGQVLQVFARLRAIPKPLLAGSLKHQEFPVPIVTALVDPQKNLSEFWTALGNRLRPSLTVTATIALEPEAPETWAMVRTQETLLGQKDPAEEAEVLAGSDSQGFRIGGRVTDSADAPVAGATVTLVELGLRARSDSSGQFVLGMIEKGDYTLSAKSARGKKVSKISVPASPNAADGSNYDLKLK